MAPSASANIRQARSSVCFWRNDWAASSPITMQAVAGYDGSAEKRIPGGIDGVRIFGAIFDIEITVIVRHRETGIGVAERKRQTVGCIRAVVFWCLDANVPQRTGGIASAGIDFAADFDHVVPYPFLRKKSCHFIVRKTLGYGVEI